ncbi:MAG: class I SAM-dependent methyltransferase [Candidatus Binatia bacterium]
MSNPAETYESFMVPVLFAPAAAQLVQLAAPQKGERVLDVACGTGVVARLVAARAKSPGKVVGLDLNPNMLVVARATAEREGRAIEWYEGRAESLPFDDASFDLVLCQHALQFMRERAGALAEMRRVLTSGGRLALNAWQGLDRHPFYQTLHDVIGRRLGMSGVQDIFALGAAGDLSSLVMNAGFRHVEITPVSITARFPDPAGFLAGEIDVDTAAIPSMQHLDAPARQAITAAIQDDMADALREVTQGDHVVLPFYAHIVCAER